MVRIVTITGLEPAVRSLTGLSRYGERYRMEIGAPDGPEWIRADRLLDPGDPALDWLLAHDYRGRGQVSMHATALTLMAVYAGRVPAAAILLWALDGVVLDIRPQNVWIKPSERPGIAAVAVRDALVDPVAALPGLYEAVLTEHLLPLADILHWKTRAGLRQLRGGVAAGAAMAFCAATREGLDAELMLRRWTEFAAEAPGDLAPLGDVALVDRGARGPILGYLRNTCCLYYTAAESAGIQCSTCCLTTRTDRLAAYCAS
jgi:hypothetical protein